MLSLKDLSDQLDELELKLLQARLAIAELKVSEAQRPARLRVLDVLRHYATALALPNESPGESLDRLLRVDQSVRDMWEQFNLASVS